MLAPEPWICYFWPKQNLRCCVPQWQTFCFLHLGTHLPLLSLSPRLSPVSAMKLAPLEPGHLDVPVRILDRCVHHHTEFPLPLLVETVPISVWKTTHLLLLVHGVLGEMILPQARCDMSYRPSKWTDAFLNNCLRKGTWSQGSVRYLEIFFWGVCQRDCHSSCSLDMYLIPCYHMELRV